MVSAISASRSPHGERGLKYNILSKNICTFSRSPHGERGLKSGIEISKEDSGISRSPHGERGLKCEGEREACLVLASLPAWGAWIEI